MKRYEHSQHGTPYVKTSCVIMGDRQIQTFEAMCLIEGRRPHEMVADIVLEKIRKAQHDHEVQEVVAARDALQVPDGGDGRPAELPPTPIEALRGKTIAILRAESPLPISTAALADRLGLSAFERQARLYPILDRLAKRGQRGPAYELRWQPLSLLAAHLSRRWRRQ